MTLCSTRFNDRRDWMYHVHSRAVQRRDTNQSYKHGARQGYIRRRPFHVHKPAGETRRLDDAYSYGYKGNG